MFNFLLNKDWRVDLNDHKSPYYKIAIYNVIRPLLSYFAKRHLSIELIKSVSPEFVLPDRGMPLETSRKWATNYTSLKNKTILVQGTGTGWDIIYWLSLKPKKIIATDLYSFKSSWEEITEYCKSKSVEVIFQQASMEDHSFLDDDSIDLVASNAVYEHCTNLPAVMRETHRILKPDGYVFACYGPLWYCAGGDHFSGRGGLKTLFNHLLLDQDDYQSYCLSQMKKYEYKQSGARYIELGLFSGLNTKEYIQLYKDSNFAIDSLGLEISSKARKFMENYPSLFAKLQKKYSNCCSVDDFLIKLHFVRLKKMECN